MNDDLHLKVVNELEIDPSFIDVLGIVSKNFITEPQLRNKVYSLTFTIKGMSVALVLFCFTSHVAW